MPLTSPRTSPPVTVPQLRPFPAVRLPSLHTLRKDCPTCRRTGTAATEALSRRSTSTWAPGLSNKYCRPVTGPVTVSLVLPIYSNVAPACRENCGCGPVTMGPRLGGRRLGIVPRNCVRVFPQHIFLFLFVLVVNSSRSRFLPGCQSFQQNRPPGKRRPQ